MRRFHGITPLNYCLLVCSYCCYLPCSGEGLSDTTGQCSEGYYCPGGQQSYTPQGLECWMGHYCTLGSIIPTACPLGYAQLQTTQSACIECPPGYFCDPNEGENLPSKAVIQLGSMVV